MAFAAPVRLALSLRPRALRRARPDDMKNDMKKNRAVSNPASLCPKQKLASAKAGVDVGFPTRTGANAMS
jgi:hypothetical protein